MKKRAIFFCLNSAKAFNPRASTRSTEPSDFLISHDGKVKAYAANTRLKLPLTTNCHGVAWKPSKSMHHIVAMKPTVPNTRMGGKSLTVSMSALTKALKATEFVKAIVGIKNATEIV